MTTQGVSWSDMYDDSSCIMVVSAAILHQHDGGHWQWLGVTLQTKFKSLSPNSHVPTTLLVGLEDYTLQAMSVMFAIPLGVSEIEMLVVATRQVCTILCSVVESVGVVGACRQPFIPLVHAASLARTFIFPITVGLLEARKRVTRSQPMGAIAGWANERVAL
jgi:hypothetical protein